MNTVESMPMPSFVRTQREFTGHLRAPSDVAAPADVPAARMALYRELVYGNVERMLANLFPVLRRVTPDDDWYARVQAFFQHHTCRSGLFTRIAREFATFLVQSDGLLVLRPFECELVDYEALDYEMSIDPREISMTDVDPEGDLLEGCPVVSPLARIVVYDYPVHRIGPGFIPEAPPALPTVLVVCRDRADHVGFIELNPVAARLLELLQEAPGQTGRAVLAALAGEIAHPDPSMVLTGGTEILARLRARDVLLGTSADPGLRQHRGI
ncbi:MAG: DUF2063 domain-containing protein [Gammaproteobacteria bacterium]